MRKNAVTAREKFIKRFKETIVSKLIKGLEKNHWRRAEVKLDPDIDPKENFVAVICKGEPSYLFSIKVELSSSWQINGGSYQVGVQMYRGDERFIFLKFCLPAHYGQQPKAGDISKLKLFLESCKKIAYV